MTGRSRSCVAIAALAALLAPGRGRAQSARPPAPWQRTEMHEPCASFNVLRSPYFGDIHVHTTQSVDAVLFNTLTTPRQAYEFAQGAALGLAPFDAQGHPAHTVQLGRPLDFAAVTDHSEGFGTQSVCFVPGFPGYDSTSCQVLRQASTSNDPSLVAQVFLNLLLQVVLSSTPKLPADVCGTDAADCAARQSVFWLDDQAAAEESYDRSAACTFTSFVAYEWSGTPNNANLHRNVIFRNAVVPALPVSYIDQQTPQGLWASLEAGCQGALASCDWLAIPHNSNLSGPQGLMFMPENGDGSPLTAADAATRAAMEPLVEIYQHKGSSECRPGVDTADEQCGFEVVNRTILIGPRNPTQTFPRLAFVRNALKEGLVVEQLLGVNPFRLGIIASTDTHNGDPGNVREDSYVGHVGVNDDAPEHNQLTLSGQTALGEHSPAGLAVVWAEENSRDALFSAMRRRETYGTSGPRHLVRFFAGRYAKHLCADPEFVATGYRRGATMGAEVGPLRGGASPVFAVLAMKDPGDPGLPGTPLQRVQIVKGWVDASGAAREKVFDVAGNGNNGAGVDLATCKPTGTGSDSLCATWTDPEFRRDQRAFYYARVLENPTCRWSTYVCNRNAIDCSDPAAVPAAFALCCDPTVPKTIQERSWASPIWYRPEALGAVQAAVSYGRTAGTDVLKLTARFGRGLRHDLAMEDLRIIVRDDDDVLDVTIPAGTLRGGRVENFAGLRRATFIQNGKGPAKLVLKTVPRDLGRADRVDHMVDVEVRIGPTFVTSQSRLWTFTGKRLETK